MSGVARALDRLDAGDWDGAHDMVAEDGSAAAAWLHAHLHRLEGDPGNAAYWYRRAGRPPFDGGADEERAAIRAALGQGRDAAGTPRGGDAAGTPRGGDAAGTPRGGAPGAR